MKYYVDVMQSGISTTKEEEAGLFAQEMRDKMYGEFSGK